MIAGQLDRTLTVGRRRCQTLLCPPSRTMRSRTGATTSRRTKKGTRSSSTQVPFFPRSYAVILLLFSLGRLEPLCALLFFLFGGAWLRRWRQQYYSSATAVLEQYYSSARAVLGSCPPARCRGACVPACILIDADRWPPTTPLWCSREQAQHRLREGVHLQLQGGVLVDHQAAHVRQRLILVPRRLQ